MQQHPQMMQQQPQMMQQQPNQTQQLQPKVHVTEETEEDQYMESEYVNVSKSFFDFLRDNSKLIGVLFVLFLLIQLESVNNIVNTLLRLLRLPDNTIFVSSKILLSLFGVLVFFMILRNI